MKSTSSTLTFDKQAILKACGASYYQRGAAYQREGRVRRLELEWSTDEPRLTAEVRGSGGKRYELTIEFEPRRNHAPLIEGFCSCPIGYNCKHVAAALLEYLNRNANPAARSQPPPNPAAQITRWQESLQARQRLARQRLATVCTAPVSAAPEQVLYVLAPRRHADNTEIAVELVRTRLLQHGGYGKATPFSFYSSGYYYGYFEPPAWLSEADRAILKRFYLSAGELRSGHLKLTGEDGALLLKHMLRTGRCHLRQHATPPLLAGPPRRVVFDWQRAPDGLTRLRVQPEGIADEWFCCPTDPPWYIDPEQGRCGPLVQPLPGELLDALGYLPPTPAAELENLSRFIFRTLPSNSLPLPVPLPSEEIAGETAVPVLTLVGLEPKRSVVTPSARTPAVRLEFAYRAVRIAPGIVDEAEVAFVEHAGREYRIRRDLQTELAALAVLAGLNFDPIPAQHLPPTIAPGGLYLTLPGATTAARVGYWRDFLFDQRPQLEADGWIMEQDPSFQLRFVEPQRWLAKLTDDTGQNWFELDLALEIEGQRVALLPLLTTWLQRLKPGELPALLASEGDFLIALEGGVWARLPLAQLRPVLEILVELYDGVALSAGALRLPRQQAATLLALEEALAQRGGAGLRWQGAAALRELAGKLRDFSGIQAVAPPSGFGTELRPYQHYGLNWLQFLREYSLGGILADDMGLGKTVQTLAHLLLEKQAGRLTRPALVVAPTSLMGNWRREAERFAPALRVLVLHGVRRAEDFARIQAQDLVLTTYPLLHRDEDLHRGQRYHSVVLDEAQAIKNPHTKAAQAAYALQAEHRLCLTGTPLENHLGELWSLFHFIMPGFLGEERRFNQLFRQPIEKKEDTNRQQELIRRIKPFILRRTKQAVARELPPKSEILQSIPLAGDQALLYESIRVAMEVRVRDLLQRQGLARSHIDVLDALLKLRQACCDPRLVKLDAARKVKQSAKLNLLLEMLPELLAEGHKVLLFSQFTTMLGLIEAELKKAKITYSKLTGQTRKRDEAIKAFQDGAAAVFLVSLKAGGVGLNLTAADTVILYDPWWNPAAEQQAIDRSHRIGQDKPVFVYKFIAEHTVEEKILDLQRRKQALADSIYGEGVASLPLSAEEILDLFQPVTRA